MRNATDIINDVKSEIITRKPNGYSINEQAERKIIDIIMNITTIVNAVGNDTMQVSIEGIDEENEMRIGNTEWAFVRVEADDFNIWQPELHKAFTNALSIADVYEIVAEDNKVVLNLTVYDLYVKDE